MTWTDWFFPVAAVIAILLWRVSVIWIWRLHQAQVTTQAELLRDPLPRPAPPLVTSLRGPGSKGFEAQVDRRELDRRAHVLAMQTRRRGL